MDRGSLARQNLARCGLSAAKPVTVAIFLLVAGFRAHDAKAQFGPCKTAAPTTPNVVVFVADIARAVSWYRNNIGLAERPRSDAAEQSSVQMTVMARGGNGITLAASGQWRSADREPQVVCFVLEGPPAPPLGAPPVFLIDPDGVSVELPAPADQPTQVHRFR